MCGRKAKCCHCICARRLEETTLKVRLAALDKQLAQSLVIARVLVAEQRRLQAVVDRDHPTSCDRTPWVRAKRAARRAARRARSRGCTSSR